MGFISCRSGSVTPRQYYQSHTKEQCADLAKRAGTSPANFHQISIGGSVGKSLAERLAKASDGEMTELEILYPERYETKSNQVA